MNMQLTTFEFRFDDDSQMITAEAGALEGLNATLKILQINNCLNDTQTIQNLTGELTFLNSNRL